MTEPRVSEWDREYFRRLGEWKAESHREALKRASKMTVMERMMWALDAANELGIADGAERDVEAMEGFYRRARELGLYRL